MADAVNILFSVPNLDPIKASVLSLIPVFERLARSGKVAVESSAKDQLRAQKTADDAIVKSAKDAAKAKESAAKEATRTSEREEKERVRILNAINALEVRDWQTKERAKTQELNAEASKRKRAAESEARAAEQTLMRRSRGFGSTMGSAAGRVMGIGGRIAGVVAGIGGGFAIADALGAGIEQERQAGIIYRGAANKGSFASAKGVQDLAVSTSVASGNTVEDTMSGLDMFVRKTGDLGAAKSMLDRLAAMSSASGASFADMGNTSAEIFNQLNDPRQTLDVMRALVGQGMAGAIDIKDLGQYGGRLAASAVQFTGDAAGNIESFGAIAQLAKKYGGADVAEATMAVQHLPSDFAKHADVFQAAGVDVYTDKSHTKFRNAEDVLTESVVKTGGDRGKLGEMYGERSIRAAIGAQVAFANAGGGAAGEAAIRSQFASLKSNTPSDSDIDRGAAERTKELSAQINIALTEFNRQMGENLLPLVPGMIREFTTLIPALARMAVAVGSAVVPAIETIEPAVKLFADSMTSHPWATIIGGAIVAQIASAGIQVGVQSVFTTIAEKVLKLFSNTTTAVANIEAGVVNVASGASVVPDVVKTVVSGGGAAAVGAGAAIVGLAAVSGYAYADQMKSQAGAAATAADLISAGTSGTPEERQARLSRAQGMVAEIRSHKDTYGGAVDEYGRSMGESAQVAGTSDRLKELEQVVAKLADSMKSVGESAAMASNAMSSMKTPNAPEPPGIPTGGYPNIAP